MNKYPTLDEMILTARPGALLTPVCAKEVYVLRTIGVNWQRFLKPVAEAHRDLMAHPQGFGSVDFKLYVTRKVMEGSMIQTVGQPIDLPQEIFEWPLRK